MGVFEDMMKAGDEARGGWEENKEKVRKKRELEQK